MITITLQAADAAELQFHVKNLSRVFRGEKKGAATLLPAGENPVDKKADIVDKSATKQSTPTAYTSEASKRRGPGRPPGPASKIAAAKPANKKTESDTPPTLPTSSLATESEEPQVTSYPTKEEGLAALKQVTDVHGPEKGVPIVREVLARLGRDRFSAVEDNQRADLIELCKKAVKSGHV